MNSSIEEMVLVTNADGNYYSIPYSRKTQFIELDEAIQNEVPYSNAWWDLVNRFNEFFGSNCITG